MRKATLGLIIFWSILAVLLSMALIAGILFAGRGGSTGIGIIGGADGPTAIYLATGNDGADVLFDKSYPIDSVKTLRIDLTSDEVDIIPVQGSQIRVIQRGVNLEEYRIITVVQSGSTFTVTKPRQNNNWFKTTASGRSYVEIQLPESYREAMVLDLTSGSVQLHGDWSLTSFAIDITSGKIETEGIAAKTTGVDMTSGSVSLGPVSTESFLFDSTSGNLQVESLTGSGVVSITSGTVKLDRLELADSLLLDLTSGNITVGIVGSPAIDFFADRTSGTINTYFETNKQDNGRRLTAAVGEGNRKKIDVDMTSGTVNITSVD